MTKVFIDGSAGTTGLRIVQRLSERKDITLLKLDEEKRKNPEARAEMLNSADIAFLCLPDEAAVEAVNLIQNTHTAVIDTSTAHRTSPGWVYGFAELQGQYEKIAGSKRVANPGCHASGFIALVKPLISAELIDPEEKLSCFSLTGYSGGGKKMIAEYEGDHRSPLLKAPRQYALNQNHKHLREMSIISGLKEKPIFCPIVSDFLSGMEVTVPLFADSNRNVQTISELYQSYYSSGLVRFVSDCDESGFLSSGALSGSDAMEISVHGNEERLVLVARFDNLGKGASGAAIQNMNILLGVDSTTGLIS